MNSIFRENNLIYLLLFLAIISGFVIIEDYGIGIEEHFQRKSGFFWLNFLFNFTEFEFLKNQIIEKINEIKQFTPNLYPIEKVPYYGVIFDLPLAFAEIILKIDEPLEYFLLRHKMIFLLFLMSAFLFYKILFLRFKNTYLALFGFLIYIFSPRIFGNIFFDNKDILFLSFLTINFFYFQKYFQNKSTRNLIVLSLFCSISTSTRIIGVLLPISFIIILLLEYLSDNDHKKIFKNLLIFLSFYIFFLFIHWPYLWTLSLNDWSNFFKPFFQAMNLTVYFDGEFYKSKHLPLNYIPYWIMLTTPIYILLFFFIGFYNNLKRFLLRFINIDNKKKIFKFDLWRSNNEKFDILILLNFFLITLLYISVKLALLSGWRHFYFVNFFIIYFSCFSIYLVMALIRNKKSYIKKIFLIILISLLSMQIYDIFKFHPFQSSYFNSFVSNDKKKGFEIDTQSLSRVHAIKEIMKIDKDLINLGTASWTPFEDARSMIPKSKWKKLNFVGTNFEIADFIYSNHYYEVNYQINNKYQIPKDFSLYKTFLIDGTRVYSIYKRN